MMGLTDLMLCFVSHILFYELRLEWKDKFKLHLNFVNILSITDQQKKSAIMSFSLTLNLTADTDIFTAFLTCNKIQIRTADL